MWRHCLKRGSEVSLRQTCSCQAYRASFQSLAHCSSSVPLIQFICVEEDSVPLICTWKSKSSSEYWPFLFSWCTVCGGVGCTTGLGYTELPWAGESLLQLIKGDLRIQRNLEPVPSRTAQAKPGELAALNASFVRSHLTFYSIFRKWVHWRWVKDRALKWGPTRFWPCKVYVVWNGQRASGDTASRR